MVFDRKSPPFPPKAGEGWGTFKFIRESTLERKPKKTGLKTGHYKLMMPCAMVGSTEN
jgi:hypothetical protein